MRGDGKKGSRRVKPKPGLRPAKAGAKPTASRMWFHRTNLVIFVGGLLAIAAGYLLLAQGSVTAAPALLVLGYCFLVPLSLFWRPHRSGAVPSGGSSTVEASQEARTRAGS